MMFVRRLCKFIIDKGKEKKMKTKRVLLFVIVALLFATGCEGKKRSNSDENLLVAYNNSISMDEIFKGNNEVLEVATPYSVLYKSGKKRNMFIFSEQVRAYDGNKYVLPDLSFQTSVDDSYEFCFNNMRVVCLNDQIHFQSQGKSIMTMVMDKWNRQTMDESGSNVQYVSSGFHMTISPTFNGVEIEIDVSQKVNQIFIPINFSKCQRENDEAGYVVLKDQQQELYIIHQAAAEDKNRTVYGLKSKIIKKNGAFGLTYSLDDNMSIPGKLKFTVNAVSEQFFFDSSAYENTPTTNSIYNHYSYFDNRYENAGGYTYLKFNARSFTPKNSELLDYFYFTFYVEYVENPVTIELYAMSKDWCSWRITWNKKPSANYKFGECTIDQAGWYTINLTSYIKTMIDSNYFLLLDNSLMMKVKDDSVGYVVMASTDHGLYPPFFEVGYRVE